MSVQALMTKWKWCDNQLLYNQSERWPTVRMSYYAYQTKANEFLRLFQYSNRWCLFYFWFYSTFISVRIFFCHPVLHNSFLLSYYFWKSINKWWNGTDLKLALWARAITKKRGIISNRRRFFIYWWIFKSNGSKDS